MQYFNLAHFTRGHFATRHFRQAVSGSVAVGIATETDTAVGITSSVTPATPAPPAVPRGGDDVWSEEYRTQERKRRDEKTKTRRVRRAELEAIYRQITEGATPEEAEAAAELVEPFAAKDAAPVPAPAEVNWKRLAAEKETARRLMAALEELERVQAQRRRDNDDLMTILLS